MKKVALIFTGGTISMKVNSKLQGAVPSMAPNELIDTLKAETDYDNLVGIDFSKLPSPSITPDKMYDLKLLVDQYLDNDAFYGVVVVHGTDTLEETAFYLDAVNNASKPIVLTGSMKNASELGYDGLTNLDSSIKVVMDDNSKGRGVLVVMNYQIHAACEVTKTHTLNLDTFKSTEFGPLGIIDADDVIYYRLQTLRKAYGLRPGFNDKVGLIEAYAGMHSDIIDFFTDNGYKGLVIAALGRGNLPAMMMDGIKRARASGMEIVIVSRALAGRVLDTYGYIGGGKDLVRNGCIMGGNLKAPKARILLMLALLNKLSHEEIRTIFS